MGDCVEEKVIVTRIKTAISVLGAIVIAVAMSVAAWVTLGSRVGDVEETTSRHDTELVGVRKSIRAKEILDAETKSDLKYIIRTIDEIKAEIKE